MHALSWFFLFMYIKIVIRMRRSNKFFTVNLSLIPTHLQFPLHIPSIYHFNKNYSTNPQTNTIFLNQMLCLLSIATSWKQPKKNLHRINFPRHKNIYIWIRLWIWKIVSIYREAAFGTNSRRRYLEVFLYQLFLLLTDV